MNLKVLPPKRFQDPYNPYFDPIRHEPWYWKLTKRRLQIPLLDRAYMEYAGGEATQEETCAFYRVDPRELRDYINWVNKTPRKAISVDQQAILDGAYMLYQNEPMVYGSGTNAPIGACIRHVASLFGVNGRHIEELWETHPSFWPTGYPIPPV